MADLIAPAALPGLLQQIKLVAGLRWRIARNGLRRKSKRMDLIGMIIAATASSILVLVIAGSVFAAVRYFLATGKASWIALMFWGIFILWQLFPVLAAGFGGSFEFRTLLRFPLRLSAFYVIGLAYGLSDFRALAAICWIIAMLGAAVPYPLAFVSLLLASILFILLNVTIERLLGAWAERLFARKRAREVFLGIFILSMISIQFVVPVVQRHARQFQELLPRVLPYFAPLPPSLVGRVVAASVQAEWGTALVAFTGLIVYVLIFSGLLVQRFAVQYRGEELSESAAPARAVSAPGARSEASDSALRIFSPEVAAMLRKEYRYFFRNGFSLLTLLLPPFLVLLFSSQYTGAHPLVAKHGVSLELFFPGIMAYLILILMAPAYNSFAYEGRGIQTYFMSPLRFRSVLLGKNLTLASLLFVEVVFAVLVFAFRAGFPSPSTFLATMMAMIFVVVGQFAIANWSSLSFPRKLEFGQMRNQRQGGMALLLVFGAQLFLGGISTLILFVGRWIGNVWLPLEAFTLLAVAAVAGYRASLDPLSDFAEKKKELLIETLCR